MLRLVLAGAASLSTPHAAETGHIEVYGVAIGAPIALVECRYETGSSYEGQISGLRGRYNVYSAESPADSPCYRREIRNIGSKNQPDGEILKVVYAVGDQPRLVPAATEINAFAVAGRIERLEFFTQGISSEKQDLEELTAKFGDPQVEKTDMQNAYGAMYTVVLATWNFPDGLGVAYTSAAGRINQGLVLISTEKGRVAWEAREARFKRSSGRDL